MNSLKTYILRENFDYPPSINEIPDQVNNSNTNNTHSSNSTITEIPNLEYSPIRQSLKSSDNLQHVREYMIDNFNSYFDSIRNSLKNHNYDMNIDQIIKPNGEIIENSFNVIMYLIIEKLDKPESVNDLIKIMYGTNHVSKQLGTHTKPNWLNTKYKL